MLNPILLVGSISNGMLQTARGNMFPLDGWLTRQPAVIDNTSNGSALTNYQVRVSVTYNALMQADFGDIRFTDSDGSTLLSHWIDPTLTVNSTSAVIWVKVPSISANSTKTIYMYYNSPLVESASDGVATFDFYDGFGDSDIWEAAGAPDGSGIAETSMVMDGSAIDMWYRGGWSSTKIGYARSEDDAALVWNRSESNPVLSTGVEIHPYVIKEGSTYYMFLKKTDTNNLYLYSSTNKTSWSIMNSGNPVYTHSSTTTDWDYKIFNPSIVIVNGVWHMLLEGQTSVSNFRIGYAYSDLDEMNWSAHRSTSHLFDNAGNPFLIAVPGRSAILMLYGSYETKWRLRARRALTANDLSLAATWVYASNFQVYEAGIHIADPDLVVTNGLKDYNIILQYGYNQANIYQKYSDLSLDDLYDAIGGGSNYTWIDEPTNPVFEAPDLGGKWTVRGSMVLDGAGAFDMPSNTNSDLTPTFETPYSATSYIMEFTAKTTSTGTRLQPVFAYVNDSNFARFWFADANTTYFQQRVSASWGPATDIGEANNAVDDVYHRHKIIKTGTQVTLFIDDNQIGSAQSLNAAFNTATKIGVSGYNTAGKWDDVRVRKYTTPEPTVSIG